MGIGSIDRRLGCRSCFRFIAQQVPGQGISILLTLEHQVVKVGKVIG